MFAVFSIIMIVGGGVSVLIGLALLIGTIRFLQIAESAAGVVVGHETKVSETPGQQRMKTAFVHPVVEFEDRSGQHRRITLATGTARYQPFTVGTQVEVLCPPNNPGRARIRSFLHLWLFPTMFTAVGLVSVAGGLLCYAWASRLSAFGL